MNKVIILVAALALAGVAFQLFQSKSDNKAVTFEDWKSAHNKKYTPEMELYRYTVYSNNVEHVAKLNQQNDGATYAINKFADLTKEEFKATYLGYKGSKKSSGSVHELTAVSNDDIDWTAAGKVSDVKDQGQCGSCWAFSATGSMESEAAIHGTGLGSFAEQQLVDCSSKYGNMGCNGGLMDYAFQYVIDNGITDEDSYPYKARTMSCSKQGGDFKISKFVDVKTCDALTNALASQPISIAVDAENWQFYSGGVFKNCKTQLDHGVLLTGKTDEYQMVKNSWGKSWGMNGYIHLAPGNTCGMCTEPSYPQI